MNDAAVRVSVVLATYRRPDLLERCLRALDRQTLDPSQYEICVADDAGLASTREQIEGLAREFRATLKYISVTGSHGPAAARNRGWQASRGPLIAFTDDDTIPDPSWLENGLRAVERPDVVAASGCVVMPLPDVPTDYERNESGLCRAEFVTANCFVRREALEAVGGFDERFRMAWREDSDLHFSLLRYAEARGFQLTRAKDALVVHPVRPAKWGVCLSQQKKSLFNALLYKKHPELYRARIQALPPLRYYLILFFILLALMGAATSSYRLLVFSAWAWAMLTASFAIQRLCGTSWSPSHIAEMFFTSALIPPLSVYWRIRGAMKFRVPFL
ncbi:MAG: glycosyltransferase family 2 protein [Bdellovibrionia bacterium]